MQIELCTVTVDGEKKQAYTAVYEPAIFSVNVEKQEVQDSVTDASDIGLKNCILQLKNEERVYQLVTDKAGFFHARNVQPGTYALILWELPDETAGEQEAETALETEPEKELGAEQSDNEEGNTGEAGNDKSPTLTGKPNMGLSPPVKGESSEPMEDIPEEPDLTGELAKSSALQEDDEPIGEDETGPDEKGILMAPATARASGNSTGSVIVSVVDNEGKGLEGVTVGLFKRTAPAFTAAAAEDTGVSKSGTVTFSGLAYGDYIVKALNVPSGHVLDDTAYEVTLSDKNREMKVSITCGEIMGTVHIENLTIDGRPIPGSVIGLFPASVTDFTLDTALSTTETDTSGIAEFTGVKTGNYKVVQLSAPAAYMQNSTVSNVLISSNGQKAEVKITNEKLGVNREESSGTPTPTPTPGTSNATGSNTTSSGAGNGVPPQTGDDFVKVLAPVVSALISLVIFLCLFVLPRRAKKDPEEKNNE